MPIKANHYINILYYFLYLTLSNSTSFEAFLTGGDWSKIGSADAFVTAAGQRLIGSERGYIVS